MPYFSNPFCRRNIWPVRPIQYRRQKIFEDNTKAGAGIMKTKSFRHDIVTRGPAKNEAINIFGEKKFFLSSDKRHMAIMPKLCILCERLTFSNGLSGRFYFQASKLSQSIFISAIHTASFSFCLAIFISIGNHDFMSVDLHNSSHKNGKRSLRSVRNPLDLEVLETSMKQATSSLRSSFLWKFHEILRHIMSLDVCEKHTRNESSIMLCSNDINLCVSYRTVWNKRCHKSPTPTHVDSQDP